MIGHHTCDYVIIYIRVYSYLAGQTWKKLSFHHLLNGIRCHVMREPMKGATWQGTSGSLYWMRAAPTDSQQENRPSVLQLQGDAFSEQPEGTWKQIFPQSSLLMRSQPQPMPGSQPCETLSRGHN